jgi:hypothetical protein
MIKARKFGALGVYNTFTVSPFYIFLLMPLPRKEFTTYHTFMIKKFFFLTLILTYSFFSFGKVYEFKKLYKDLGYDKQKDYFNSTPDEVMSIESYIEKYESYYVEINNYLRYHPAPYEWDGTSPEDAKKNVRDIDHIISKAPEIPNDIILFRGLTLKWRQDKAFEIGEEYVDKAYISTSTTYSVAEYFAKGLSSDKITSNKKALFALYFDQAHIKGLLIDQGEDEVLLKHGERFKIMKKKEMGEYDYYLVQVCQKKCAPTIQRTEVLEWWKSQL